VRGFLKIETESHRGVVTGFARSGSSRNPNYRFASVERPEVVHPQRVNCGIQTERFRRGSGDLASESAWLAGLLAFPTRSPRSQKGKVSRFHREGISENISENIRRCKWRSSMYSPRNGEMSPARIELAFKV
jgi:hypothetical protein